MLPDFSVLRVLVVGDLMLDRYLSGRVDRISPEAPVPVLRYLSQEDRLGGAANVALNLRALGASVSVAGVAGADDNAVALRDALAVQGIGADLLYEDSARPTTVKTRIIAQDQQLLRVDRESTEALPEEVAGAFLAGLKERIEGKAFDLIILQDYNKGVLTKQVIEQVSGYGEKAGVLVAVDPKDMNFWSYRGVHLFKPNLREIQQQCDFAVDPTLPSLDRAARVIFERLGCRCVMITLSEHGIYTHDGDQSTIEPTVARRIADVSGAGDTVISVAACALAKGLNLRESARLANQAGAQVIAKPGVVAVDLTELRTDWSARA